MSEAEIMQIARRLLPRYMRDTNEGRSQLLAFARVIEQRAQALRWLDDNEPKWDLERPIDRSKFLRLIEESK